MLCIINRFNLLPKTSVRGKNYYYIDIWTMKLLHWTCVSGLTSRLDALILEMDCLTHSQN